MKGKLHRHEDGTEHRHFAAGLTIGAQSIPDDDGSTPHEHGTMPMASADNPSARYSGPVVAVLED